jgi:hypothetical protein
MVVAKGYPPKIIAKTASNRLLAPRLEAANINFYELSHQANV